jgi:hypothetical protein
MPIIVRVRWSGGFLEVSDGNLSTPARTIPFDAGNVKSRAKALEVGQTVLQEWATRPVRSWQTRVGDTPSWPSVGDRIETYDMDGTLVEQRIASRRVSILPGGFASLEPTLGTRRDLLVERNQRALKKLTDGLQGRSSASDPLLSDKDTGFAAGQMSERSVMSWQNAGLKAYNRLTLRNASAKTDLTETTTLTRLQMLLTNNNVGGGNQVPVVVADSLTLNGWYNNQSIGLFSFPAGVSEWNILLANSWPANTTIQYGLADAGDFALNPTSTIQNYTLTLNLFGVTGTWVQETKNDPEIR